MSIPDRDQQSSDNDRWCILTTGYQRTLRLAETLTEAGFTAWTPIGFVGRRRPRSDERNEIQVPVTPSLVFARVGADALEAREGLLDLWRAVKAYRSPHPQFSLFQSGGEVPLIRASSLDGLRMEQEAQRIASEFRVLKEQGRVRQIIEDAERRAAKDAARKAMRERLEAEQQALRAVRAAAPKFNIDDRVVCERPEFAGMVGVVQTSRRHQTLVLFGGPYAMKIETWQLHPAALSLATAI